MIEYIILYGIILHVYHYIRRSFLTDPEGERGRMGKIFPFLDANFLSMRLVFDELMNTLLDLNIVANHMAVSIEFFHAVLSRFKWEDFS